MQTLNSKELPQTATASKRTKKTKTNSHGTLNHMTQTNAIKADVNQQVNRRIRRATAQRS
jgi:hypothetical protein